MRDLTPLCRLAAKHHTDKGGRHLTYGNPKNTQYGVGSCHATHEYTPIYWDLLHKQRDIVHSVLEIGVNQGCSLLMWQDFFPNAKIIGLDIDTNFLINEDRIRCFQANQNDPHSLRNALQLAGAHPYDLIIDDGSHELEHQATSLATLLPYLSDTGVYVVEDIPLDQSRADHLANQVPEGYHFGVVFPELAHGDGWPEQLFIVTREAK